MRWRHSTLWCKLGSLWVAVEFMMLQSAWAAVTKCHQLGGLNNRSLISHNSLGWKSQIIGLEWWSSYESALPGLQTATFSLCPCVAEGGKQAFWALIPSWDNALMPLSKPNYLPKAQLQILSHWRLGLRVAVHIDRESSALETNAWKIIRLLH